MDVRVCGLDMWLSILLYNAPFYKIKEAIKQPQQELNFMVFVLDSRKIKPASYMKRDGGKLKCRLTGATVQIAPELPACILAYHYYRHFHTMGILNCYIHIPLFCDVFMVT